MTDPTKKTWAAVDITAVAEAQEAIEFALNELDALGTEIDSLRKKKGEPLVITGFFDNAPCETEVRSQADRALEIYGFGAGAVISIEFRLVEETDWLAEWKKYWKATEIGNFVIAPPWESVDDHGKHVIRIEPNMAFGTGTHETTKLCLKAIDESYDGTTSFLDVGTGTGILAIAAAKLGGTGIFACDTDEDSVKIARENAALNGVAERIEFADRPIDANTPLFDFVAANLTVDVIEPILPLLISKAGSRLLLSGILAEQEGIIKQALDKVGADNYKIERDGEWISVLVEVN